MSRRLRRGALPALCLALLLMAPDCPQFEVVSLDVTGFRKGRATFDLVISLDNPDKEGAWTDSCYLSLALPQGWDVHDFRYRIPGENLDRRLRPAPDIAARAWWVFDHPDGVWWSYTLARHSLPPALSTYSAVLEIDVPRKSRSGDVVLVLYSPDTSIHATDPENHAANPSIGAWSVTLRPRLGTKRTAPPPVHARAPAP